MSISGHQYFVFLVEVLREGKEEKCMVQSDTHKLNLTPLEWLLGGFSLHPEMSIYTPENSFGVQLEP